MKILVAGEGTRAFAVAKHVEKFGNTAYLLPEIATEGRFRTLACDPNNAGSVSESAEKEQISLTVITDENIMTSELPDKLEGKGIRVFAPASRTIKTLSDRTTFAELANAAGVPIAPRREFSSTEEAKNFINGGAVREYFVKSPCIGTSVFTKTKEEAVDAIDRIFPIGNAVVIETCVFGHPMGVSVITDGKTSVIAPATSPSTDERCGRYGAVAPDPYYGERVADEIKTRIIRPFLAVMKRVGIESCGWYNFDIMLTGYGPVLIGTDFFPPETEAETLLALIESDFAAAAASAACGTLKTDEVKFSSDFALTVAVDDKTKRKARRAIEKKAYVYVNFGRVRFLGDEIKPQADRIATVTVSAPTFNSAYHGAMDVAELSGLGGTFRRDVGAAAYGEICRIRSVLNAKLARLAEIEKNREILTNTKFTEFDYTDPEYLERLKNSHVLD